MVGQSERGRDLNDSTAFPLPSWEVFSWVGRYQNSEVLSTSLTKLAESSSSVRSSDSTPLSRRFLFDHHSNRRCCYCLRSSYYCFSQRVVQQRESESVFKSILSIWFALLLVRLLPSSTTDVLNEKLWKFIFAWCQSLLAILKTVWLMAEN